MYAKVKCRCLKATKYMNETVSSHSSNTRLNFLHLVQLTLHTMHEEEGSPIAGKPIISEAHADLPSSLKSPTKKAIT